MSHALSAGADLVEATQCYRVWEIRYAFNKHFIKNVEDLISACRKHVVAATGPSPFKVGDNQRPERTGSGAPKTFAGVFRPRRKPDRGKEAESILQGIWKPIRA